MKKIYFLFILIACAVNSNAQLSLTKAANAPTVGTTLFYFDYDSTSAVPKATGTNKSWNFTSFTLQPFGSSTYTFVSPASTPSAGLFPTANLATDDGNSTHDYYNSQATYLDLVGTVDVQNNGKGTFSDPQRQMVWPFTYGNSNADSFAGTQVYGTTTITASGNTNITGSGTGTITLPGGQKYNNCLQVTRTSTNVIGVPFSVTITVTEYEYWVSTFKNPIMAVGYSAQKTGTTTTKAFYATTNSLADVGINEHNTDEETFVVYPNPVKENLNVALKNNLVPEKLELYDAMGRLVLCDEHKNSLNTSALNKGVYVLKVISEGAVMQKQVIVTE